MPFSHQLCGSLDYTSSFNSAQIDSSSSPLSYDSASLTYAIYSEDRNLIGPNLIELQALFVQYPSVTSGSPVEIDLEIIDPCLDPFDLQAPTQDPVPDYYYTFDQPALTVNTKAFIVDPPVCGVTYSCQIVDGPRLDICDFSDGDTSSFFDPSTGDFRFMSTNIVDFEPGTYKMEITGTSGAKQQSFVVDLVMIDPCFSVDLDVQANPFSDRIYVLRDPEIPLPWRAIDLIKPKTEVDCGPIAVEFFNDDATQSVPRSDLFLDDRSLEPDNAFKVIYAEDVALKGSYPIRYRVFHERYPLNVAEQPFPFTVTVINSCENPKSLTASTLTDQEYTITDAEKKYVVPLFTIDPSWCDVVYSFSVEEPEGQFAVKFSADQNVREFTFFNDDRISLAASSEKRYTITVKAVSGIVTFQEAEAIFDLTLKNPCVDPAFV